MIPLYDGKRIVAIYTDGACSGNQNDENLGGWGAILEYGEAVKELFGGEPNTTNNRMELTAVLEAFRALKKDGLDIAVFSDSAYLANCFRERWYEGWRRNGWRNAKKQPVENRDLWEEILGHTERNRVRFYRVKGHINVNGPSFDPAKEFLRFREWNGEAFSEADFLYATERNNRADALANRGIDEQRKAGTSREESEETADAPDAPGNEERPGGFEPGAEECHLNGSEPESEV